MTTEQPIACTLSAREFSDRSQAITRLARQALRSREPLEHGARLTFEAQHGIEDQLRELVAAEARCCPFMQMDLHRSGETLELDVTGPDEARPIIEALFA